MHPSRTGPSPFVASLLATVAIAGLLAAFNRVTPGGPLLTPAPPPAPVWRTPSPVVVEPNRRQAVVLVSLGGAGADALAGWMTDDAMPALSRLAARGWTATLRGADPPLPDVSLAVLATGGTVPDAEPIWQTAARYHRTTALLFWPGSDPAAPDRRADYTLFCAPPSIAAGQQRVLLFPAEPWTGAPLSFSPLYEGELTIPSSASTATWRVLAADTLDDGQAAYDTFLFAPGSEGQQTVGRDAPRLTLDGQVTLSVVGRAAPGLTLTVAGRRTLSGAATLSPTAGVTSTVSLAPTAALAPTASSAPLLELTLYRIAAQSVTARPAALGRAVIERFGFCPPLPDPETVSRGWLSPAVFREMASLRARWSMRVTAYVYETYRPHLLLTRQEALWASEQALLLTDPRQPGYSRARADEFAGHRRAVARAVDEGLDGLLAAVDLSYATVLVVSEHGTAPAHTAVNVAVALRPVWQRLARLGSDLLLAGASSDVYVEGAFLSVEIGSDEKGENAVAVKATLQALAALIDPRTAEPIFARVARCEDASSWAEVWPYPGDVLAQASPGYTLSAAPNATKVLAGTLVYGRMGYDVRLPAMQGLIVAAGRGVFAGQGRDIASLMDVAPAMAEWLNVPPPSNSP
jgi:hypothetical protein